MQDCRAPFGRGLLVAGATLMCAIALLASANASAAPPSAYYQLVVSTNESRLPEVTFIFWLDSPYEFQEGDDANWTLVIAKTLRIDVDFGPELEYNGVPGGSYADNASEVRGDIYFNVTARITPEARSAAASGTIFTSVYVNVTYTNAEGVRPRTIHRFLNVALNYAPPPASVNLAAAAVAGFGSAGIFGAGLYVIRRARLEELYLMHDSGMLIRHWSRNEGLVHDSDIMSGMFIVLQEFVRDSFDDREGSLEQLRFGPRQVLMVRGRHAVLCAVIRGRYLNGLPSKLQKAVLEFERTHAHVLARWDGNVALFRQADAIAARFIRPRSRFHPN